MSLEGYQGGEEPAHSTPSKSFSLPSLMLVEVSCMLNGGLGMGEKRGSVIGDLNAFLLYKYQLTAAMTDSLRAWRKGGTGGK